LPKAVSVDELKIGVRERFDLRGRSRRLDLRASLSHVKADLVNTFAPGLLASGSIERRLSCRHRPSPTGIGKVDVDDLRFADAAATGLPAVQFACHGAARR